MQNSSGGNITISVILLFIIGFALIFITTTAVITYKILNSREPAQTAPNTIPIDSSSQNNTTIPRYSTFTFIGQLNTRTRDQTHTVVVDMLLEYDYNDNFVQSQLTGRVNQLRDFTRNFFASKYYSDLEPENREELKLEIMSILNTRYLEPDTVKGIIFNKLDVMEL